MLSNNQHLISNIALCDNLMLSSSKNVSQQETPGLNPFDVICGRCSLAFNYIGNRRFRVIIGLHVGRYMDAPTRSAKGRVILSVVKVFKDELGSRFVKQTKDRRFVVVSASVMRQKVGHALRDLAAQREKAIVNPKIEPVQWASNASVFSGSDAESMSNIGSTTSCSDCSSVVSENSAQSAPCRMVGDDTESFDKLRNGNNCFHLEKSHDFWQFEKNCFDDDRQSCDHECVTSDFTLSSEDSEEMENPLRADEIGDERILMDFLEVWRFQNIREQTVCQ